MRVLWVLLLSITVAAVPPSAYAQPDCIEALPENKFEAQFIESANQLVAILREFGQATGDTIDFCFTTGRGATLFYRIPELRRSGIRFSIDDFNEVYQLSSKNEDAVLTNLWILLHEGSHLIAYYGNRADFLVGIQASPEVLPPKVRWRVKQSPGGALMMQRTIAASGRAGEAFADCMSAFLLWGSIEAVVANARFNDSPADMASTEKHVTDFLPSTMKVLLQRVVGTGSDVYDLKRVHGTPTERLSYVLYGMSAASFYHDVHGAKPGLVQIGTALCAANAYEVQRHHVPGRQTLFPEFRNGL